VLASAVLSLWGAFSYFGFESAEQRQSQNRDPYLIAANLERFSGFRQAIPERAVLGYLTDAEPGSTVATAIFSSAQYAVAPRLLHAGTTQEWVLGNFTKPTDYQAIGTQHGLRLEHDFGSGVVLYRKLRR
jgi:hypothetical protein